MIRKHLNLMVLNKSYKENYNVFATFITENCNGMIETLFWLSHVNKQILSQYTKKIPEMKRKIAGL